MSVENPSVPARKKIAVFDQYYNNPDYSSPTKRELFDTVGDNIDTKRHEVVAYANELGKAAAILVSMQNGDVPHPDVIVVGGTLNGEYRYLRSPEVQTEEKIVVRKRWFRPITEVVLTETLLLPFVDSHGKVTFITREEVSSPGDLVYRYDRHLEAHDSGNVVSAFVLAHLARELLHDQVIKIIGHSNSPMGREIPVDVFLFKGADDPRSLQEEIDL